MIDPKAEPIAHKSPYKRIDLAKRREKSMIKCEDCSLDYHCNVGDYCPRCGHLNEI